MKCQYFVLSEVLQSGYQFQSMGSQIGMHSLNVIIEDVLTNGYGQLVPDYDL